MSAVEITIALLLGLVVNEFSDVSPWLARRFVGWSAQLRYGDTTRAAVRTEELAAVINDRPGKLFKLGTGLRFLSSALAVRVRRFVGGQPPPTGDPASEELYSMPVLPVVDEASALVARYLFPTERFRGEWRRHWISLVKSFLLTATYAVLGSWAAIQRLKPQYVGWTVALIITAAVLFAVYRVVGWYNNRFVITNKRLMVTGGLVMRRVAMIPLLRVTDLRYVQSPLGRLLNYATFRLESASFRNAMRKIVDLPNPNELYLRLVEEMYEPAAVEARLGAWIDDVDESIDPTAADREDDPDATDLIERPSQAGRDGRQAWDGEQVAARRDIVAQLHRMAAQFVTLAEAMERLDATSEAPPSTTGPIRSQPEVPADKQSAGAARPRARGRSSPLPAEPLPAEPLRGVVD